MAKYEQRYAGELPKVGIRPTIDGRLGGVRESLEQQTLDQAKSVAKLIGAELRHSSGQKVECIIPTHCIGGAREATQVDALFARENVGLTLTVTPCWCYGSETMDMDPLRPKAVWGFNGTARPGAVYLAAVLAAHAQKGLPAFGIYGRDVQDAGERSTCVMNRRTGVGSAYRLVIRRLLARMNVMALDSGVAESSLLPTVAVM